MQHAEEPVVGAGEDDDLVVWQHLRVEPYEQAVLPRATKTTTQKLKAVGISLPMLAAG